MKTFYTFIFILITAAANAQIGSSCANPYIVYPALNCSNNCGQQLCGNMQCLRGDCDAFVTAAGSSGGLDPTCTSDNETTQSVIWIAVTATTSSFTINNGSPYVGGGAGLANTRDYVVYSGTCGSLTQIFCSTIGANSSGTVSGLTTGQVYYIMVSPASSNTTATATNTCITAPVAYSAPGNNCANAVNVVTNTTYTFTNAGSAANGPICAGSVENDTWYRWCAPSTWPAGQQAYLSVANQVCNTAQGLQLSVWNTNTVCPTSSTSAAVQCQNPGVTTPYYYQWTATANQCYYVTIDGFAGTACRFSLTIGSVIVLPIELYSFTAEAKNDFVQLNWITASETNNDHFTIERSIDGISFDAIGTIPGSGNSTSQISYSFADVNPLYDVLYYRLCQNDFDGAYTYSEPISVRFKNPANKISINPMPALDNITIEYYSQNNSETFIRFINAHGNIMSTLSAPSRTGWNKALADISAFPKGVYFITLETGSDLLRQQMIKE